MSNFKDFEIEDGVLKGYYGDENNVIIPTGITAIGDYAFECIDELFSVIIPDGVKSIGDNVFQCCHALSEIIIPNSVTSIGEEAFLDCDSLTSITIPHSVTKIGSYAFDGCVSLETVYFQSEEQKEKFKDCFGKAHLIIEKQSSVSTTPKVAKTPQTSAKLTSSSDKETTGTAEKTMKRPCSKAIDIPTSNLNMATKTIVIENGKLIRYAGNAATPNIPEGVTVIATGAFDGLENMICTNLPVTVQHVEKGAFRNCPNLFRVAILETLQSIEKGAFWNNSDRFYIDTTDGSYAARYGQENKITVVTDGLFAKNKTMKNKAKSARETIKQSNPVKMPKTSATSTSCNCKKTTAILVARTQSVPQNTSNDFVVVGGTLQKYCGSDANVILPKGITTIGAFAFGDCKSLTSVTIPDGVSTIDKYAFYGCKSLKAVTLPNSIKSIGESAFNECVSLTSIVIPRNVIDVSTSVFYGCKSLQSVTIPDSVKSIGILAFYNCPLESVYFQSEAQKEKLKEHFNTGNLIVGRQPSASTVQTSTVTSSSNSKKTTKAAVAEEMSVVDANSDDFEIENGILKKYCGKAANVILPNGVTAIGERAFGGCTSLTSITIPNSVVSIGDVAFDGCASLKSITIPNSVTHISSYMFSGCTSLTSVTIPNNVKSIGDGAFDKCTSLKSITIPNGVTSIGDWTFNECMSLCTITIPNSVTNIGDWVFDKCISLKSITIPNSVISIGRWAFDKCPIEFIYFKNGWQKERFKNTFETEAQLLIEGQPNPSSYSVRSATPTNTSQNAPRRAQRKFIIILLVVFLTALPGWIGASLTGMHDYELFHSNFWIGCAVLVVLIAMCITIGVFIHRRISKDPKTIEAKKEGLCKASLVLVIAGILFIIIGFAKMISTEVIDWNALHKWSEKNGFICSGAFFAILGTVFYSIAHWDD